MGQFADRLDAIRLRVRAPGVELEAELRDRTRITIEFGESVYDFISERALESALADLARLLYAGWQREYRAAVDDTSLELEPRDQHDLNFRNERRQLECRGESGDGRVTISAVGMEDFSIRITPGTVRELRERDFVQRVAEATALLFEDYQQQGTELEMRYYG